MPHSIPKINEIHKSEQEFENRTLECDVGSSWPEGTISWKFRSPGQNDWLSLSNSDPSFEISGRKVTQIHFIKILRNKKFSKLLYSPTKKILFSSGKKL